MTRRARLSAGLVLALVLVLAAAGAVLLRPVQTVVVRAGPSGRALWSHPVSDIIPFRLEYVHSVERTPVVEHYEARPTGLHLVKMEFVSQGAGLPSEGYVREGNAFVLRTDRPLAELSIRVSRLAAPRLVFESAAFDLVAQAGDGQVVTVSVRRRLQPPRLRP